MTDIGPFKCSELPPIGYDQVLCGVSYNKMNHWFVGIPYAWSYGPGGDEGWIRFKGSTFPTGVDAACNYWMPLPDVE